MWLADPRIGAHLGDLVAGELRSGPVLAELLEQAGCRHPTVLRALREPVHPLEAVWVAELLAGVPRGTFVAHHCGRSPFHPQPSRELKLQFDLDFESLARFRELVLELDAALRCRWQGDAMGFAIGVPASAAGAAIGRGQATITLVGDVEAGRRTVGEVLAGRHAGIGLITGDAR